MSKDVQIDKRDLTVAEVAELSKASPWFVRAQIKDGHLRARHLGHSRLLRILWSDYQAWRQGDADDPDVGAAP
jgi:hypothetical protein